MKKNRNIHPISVVVRGNTAQTLPAEEILTPESSEKPLVDLLAISSEFFIFSYSAALKSLVTWSDNARVVLGVDDRRIARDGNLFLRHVHQDDRFQLQNDLENALAGKSSFRATYRWIRPDNNEQRWLHCRAALKRANHSELLEGIILDISDEIEGPLKYFAGTESLNSILSALPGFVIIIDKDLRIIRLSFPEKNYDFSFGDFAFKKDLLKVGQNFLASFSDQQLISQIKTITNQIISGGKKAANFRIAEDGHSYKVDFFPQDPQEPGNGLICVVSDITELVQLESRVAELQKTESLRKLSSGIGHHFNNALQTIIGQATVINCHADNVELVRKASDSIVSSSIKASELTRQLFANIESNIHSLQSVDPNLVLTDALNKVEDLLNSGFEVKVVLGQLPLIKSNYHDLRAVFESLLTRARNALAGPKAIKNCLSIKTKQQRESSNTSSDLKSGEYAVVSISNCCSSLEGPNQADLSSILGSKIELSDEIHSPGSILSPAQCFSIIESFGGNILRNDKETGTESIEIYLPADLALADDEKCDFNFNANSSYKNITAPRILLIDDNQPLAASIQAMFNELDQNCLVAVNSEQACAILKDNQDSIELVLLDAILPASDSVLILKKLKQLKASLKILGFSGANNTETDQLLNEGALEILKKPVDAQTLKGVVSRYLEDIKIFSSSEKI